MALSSVKQQKDLALGYALWCLSLVGICGVQRMYLGQVGLGLFFLFTFGVCGLAQLLDLLLLPDAVNQANRRLRFFEGKSVDPIPSSNQPTTSRLQQVSSSSSVSSSDDDELDQLLRQAERSVRRADTSNSEG